MESTIVQFQESVQKADEKLDMITWQIDAFEKEFEDPDSKTSIVRLLRSMHQVKKEYQNLCQEILEVQQLGKQASDSLRTELSQMHEDFNSLRNKVLGLKASQFNCTINAITNTG